MACPSDPQTPPDLDALEAWLREPDYAVECFDHVGWMARRPVHQITALIAEVRRLREALKIIAISADDGDGWTSDGHERCTERASAALRAMQEAEK